MNKKIKKISEIVCSIKEIEGFKTKKEVYKLLNMSSPAIYNHEARNSLPYEALTKYCLLRGVDYNSLITEENLIENKQNGKLNISAETRAMLEETFSQYHKCLNLILSMGTKAQQRVPIGMLVMESDEIRKTKGIGEEDSSILFSGNRDETIIWYHKCLNLILEHGTREQRRFAIGMLVVESEGICNQSRINS